MATQPIQDQFAYLLTPTEEQPPTARFGPIHEVGTDGGCAVCGIVAIYQSGWRTITVQLPANLPAPLLIEAMVLVTSGSVTQRYEVGRDALRTLVRTGRADWALPPQALEPRAISLSFGIEVAGEELSGSREVAIA